MSYVFDLVKFSNIDKYNNPAPFTYTGPALSAKYLEDRLIRAATQIFDEAVVGASKGWVSFSRNGLWLPLHNFDIIKIHEHDNCGILKDVLKQRGIDFKCTAVTTNKPYSDSHFHEFSWKNDNPYLYQTMSIPFYGTLLELKVIISAKNMCGAPRPLDYYNRRTLSGKDFETNIVETADEIFKEIADKAQEKRISLQKTGDWISLKPGTHVCRQERDHCWRLSNVLEQRDINMTCQGITPGAPHDIHSHVFTWHPDNPYLFS